MIDIALRVIYRGEKFDATDVKGSDIVALERRAGVSLVGMRELKFEDACFLVWRIMRRAGHIGDEVAFDDDFLDGIEDMEQAPAPFEEGPDVASPG